MNLTRIGKIARLPRNVRDELNQRLDDGEPAADLLAWLNALPAVQHILSQHFAGRPISEQNLSLWRRGGFVDWQRHQEARACVARMVEESDDLADDSVPYSLAERVSQLLVMDIARLLEAGRTSENPIEQRKVVFGAARHLTRLRRIEHESQRVEMEQWRWEREKEAEEREQEDRVRHAHEMADMWKRICRRLGMTSEEVTAIEARREAFDTFDPAVEPAPSDRADQRDSNPIKPNQGFE